MKGLYFYKLVSPYQEDVTKDCKLTINEIDHNFVTLKDVDIKEISFDEQKKVLDFVRNNGDEINVDLSSMVEGITTDLRVDYDSVDGIITFEYNGEKHLINGLVTDDNIVVKALTEVISDGTLSGLGSKRVPLGLTAVEKTGTFKPAYKLIDKINGEFMPCADHLIKGDRYVTREEVSDYGFLYDFASVRQINKELKNGWRVPTKQDWDNMLNAIEPCDEFRNHDSALANNMLGKYAGKYLKTKDKWLKSSSHVPGDNSCSCGCGCGDGKVCEDDVFEIYDDSPKTKPEKKMISPVGIDSYGLGLVPAGFFDGCEIVDYFKKRGFYWSSSMINETDVYVKRFDFDKAGVVQHVECPRNFFSLRLVKDYDGSNHLQTEYINGMVYNTVLLPAQNTKHGHSIWTASNIAFPSERYNPIKPNNGEGLSSRKAFFINEWNGFDWERKEMHEGESIVLFEGLKGDKNIEYRIMNGELYSEAETIYDNVMDSIKPELDRIDEIIGDGVKDENGKIVDLTTVVGTGFTDENGERISITDKVQHIDNVLGTGFTDENGEIVTVTDKLANEIADRLAADKQFREDLDQEILDRQEADRILQENIVEETDAREQADNFINAEIDTIETNVGLTNEGNYIPRPESNYIKESATVMGAIDDLDAALKKEELDRIEASNNIQEELDKSQSSVGLEEDGSYAKRSETRYIGDAETVMGAVETLDDSLSSEATTRERYDNNIKVAVGLNDNYYYIKRENSNYIDEASSVMGAVDTLDSSLKLEEVSRQNQDDIIEENVGLDEDGKYVKTDGKFTSNAETVMGAIKDLDFSLESEESSRKDQDNVIEENIGLDEEGKFIPRPNSHFITTATTVMGAIDDLDYQSHVEQDQRYLNDYNIWGNVGLDRETGMFIPRLESNNIKDAETVMGSVDLLDSALDTERDSRVSQDDRIEAGVGLDENGDYIKLTDQDAYYIHNSENLAHAVKKLDSALKIEENDRVTVSDKIKKSVGLDAEGEYIRTEGEHIKDAVSIADSINMLDSSLATEESVRETQDNKIEKSVGLEEDGSFVINQGSNYVKNAESVVGAVETLDSFLGAEENARKDRDNTIQKAVGLNEDGTFKENVGHFIGDAKTVTEQIQLLDASLKNETIEREHGDAGVDTKLDLVKASVGLNEDGSYPKNEGNYTSEAATVVGSVDALDKALKNEETNRVNKDTYINSRLIKEGKQPNDENAKAFDSVNGILTLFAEDPKHNIVIKLNSDYGELPYDENGTV